MSANPKTPPTTPPAIAPTLVFPELDVEPFIPGVPVVCDEALVDVGSLVDSGPPVPQVRLHLRYSQKISYQLLVRMLY
jgi:hypothetical protein